MYRSRLERELHAISRHEASLPGSVRREDVKASENETRNEYRFLSPFSFSPTSSRFCFPKACKEGITKIPVRWVGDRGPGEKQTASRTFGEAGASFSEPGGGFRRQWRPLRSLRPRAQRPPPPPGSSGRRALRLSPARGSVVVPGPGITQIPLNAWLQMRTLGKKQ